MDSSQCIQSGHAGSDEITSTDKPAVTVTCACDQNLEAIFYCNEHNDVICKISKTMKHKNCK